MGVAAPPAPQNPTKKLAHAGVLLGHLLSQNRVPKLSNPEPPLNTVVPKKLPCTYTIPLDCLTNQLNCILFYNYFCKAKSNSPKALRMDASHVASAATSKALAQVCNYSCLLSLNNLKK